MATRTRLVAMSESPAPSLSRLAIDRSAGSVVRRRRPLWKRWWTWALLLAALTAVGLVVRSRGAAQQVEFRDRRGGLPLGLDRRAELDRPCRRAAPRIGVVEGHRTARVARVQEGQMVKEGDIIARLENRDVAAQREQAAAQVQAARANLAQGQAELEDAQAALKRAQDLAKQNFISARRSTPPRHGTTRRARRSIR